MPADAFLLMMPADATGKLLDLVLFLFLNAAKLFTLCSNS